MKGFSHTAMLALQRYPWPGNLRELRNVIERAVILAQSDIIEVDDLPTIFKEAHRDSIYIGRPVKFKELEREHITRVVDLSSNITEAAEILGIDSATLYRKRRRYKEQELTELQTRSATGG